MRLLLLALLCVPASAARRLVLRTVAGDLVLKLDADLAPRHAAQVERLARLGVYDGTHFYGLEPNFYAQVSSAFDRSSPLTPAQRAAIKPIKAEFSKRPHRRGTLSMSRDERYPDSAESSFCIILADWPQGDGHYTVFGEVESGMEVLEELFRVPRDSGGRPIARLEIFKAEMLTPAQLEAAPPVAAHAVSLPPVLAAAAQQTAERSTSIAVSGGIALMILVGAAAFFCVARYPVAASSLSLLTVLIGSFLLLVILTPMARFHPALGTALFLGLLGVLKLMSRFESPQ